MNFAYERDIFREMIAQLSDFVLSDVLFWQLGGSSHYPKLSLGTYLLTRTRLQADFEYQTEVAGLIQSGDAVLMQWRTSAERKALAEIQHRLRLWENFVQDGEARYATEVTHRAALELLFTFFPRLAETPEAKRLAALDQLLQARWAEGLFVWDSVLQAAFAKDKYWFLYRKLR